MNIRSLITAFFIISVIFYNCDVSKHSPSLKRPIEFNSDSKSNTIIYTNKVKYGETLLSILRKQRIFNPVSYQLISQFKKIYDVRLIKPHDTYIIEKDSSNSFISFTYQPSIERKYIVKIDSSGRLQPIIDQVELRCIEESIKGSIRTCLYDAIIELGESPELLIVFSDIFQWDIDFFIDPRVGDEFKIIVEKFYVARGNDLESNERNIFVKYGKIKAASYQLNGDEMTAIYFENGIDDSGYYTPDGESFQKTFLKSPLNYRRISSYFSRARKHPILKIVRPHYGVDFAAPSGTPVSAAGDGVILEKGYNRGIGRYIKIKHNNPRFVTLYGHLSRFAKGISKGDHVKQKQVIGFVGQTGLATGPHLHYTFYDNGRPIDPLKIKSTSGDPISENNRTDFSVISRQMQAKLKRMEYFDLPLTIFPSLRICYNDVAKMNR